MKSIFLVLTLLIYYGYALEIKNAKYFLEKNRNILESYYNQVKMQSFEKKYPYFRHRKIIEYSAYLLLENDEKKKISGQLVFINFILKDFIKYSNFGGISISGILSSEKQNKKPHIFYLKFDGRYLSDLEFLGIEANLFTYCVLPNFNQCILLGIGEKF